MRIFLIGFMGVGKTTCGKELSKHLNIEFYDTDEEIEKASNMTISEIFAKFGEDYFRKLEHKLALKLCEKQNCIVSTGGGFPIFNNNIDILNGYGITVWLDASAETILNHLCDDDTRPILKSQNKREKINKLLIERQEYYNKSDFKISIDGKKVCDIVKEIIEVVS